MLDQFLELGIETSDVGTSFEALRSLGFTAVPVGDIRHGAYAVLSDGHINIGLQLHPFDSPSLTFVRPDLVNHVRALRRRGLELEFASLGDQEFHELGFRDPNGQLVSLIEARTFPPPPREQLVPSACGRFLEYSLATGSVETSRLFWESLGLVTIASGEEPRPWTRLEGAGLTLGLHQTTRFRPGPSFVASQLEGRLDYLRAKGHAVEAGAPMFSTQRRSATVGVPGPLPLYLVEDPAQAD